MNFKKISSLTKVFLKNSFQNTQTASNKKSSKIANTVLYIFVFIYLGAIMGFVSYNMISGLVQINQEEIFLGLFFLAIAAFIVFQGIFSCINVFYFSKDIEFVLPLPVSAKEILISKFNAILLTEYILELIIGVVPLIIYGILTSAGILYYFMSAIFLLLFPILPLLLVSIIVTIIMSFAKLTKKRDAFQLIATIIVIVIAIAVSTATSSTEEVTDEQMVQNLLQANGMLTMVEDYFITLRPSINALTATSIIPALIETLKVAAITLVSYIIFILIGQKLYFKGAIGNLVRRNCKAK